MADDPLKISVMAGEHRRQGFTIQQINPATGAVIGPLPIPAGAVVHLVVKRKLGDADVDALVAKSSAPSGGIDVLEQVANPGKIVATFTSAETRAMLAAADAAVAPPDNAGARVTFPYDVWVVDEINEEQPAFEPKPFEVRRPVRRGG